MGQSKNPTTLVSFGDVAHELYLALGLSGFLLLTVLPLTIFLTNQCQTFIEACLLCCDFSLFSTSLLNMYNFSK